MVLSGAQQSSWRVCGNGRGGRADDVLRYFDLQEAINWAEAVGGARSLEIRLQAGRPFTCRSGGLGTCTSGDAVPLRPGSGVSR